MRRDRRHQTVQLRGRRIGAEDDVPAAGTYIEAWYNEMYTAFAFDEARDAETR